MYENTLAPVQEIIAKNYDYKSILMLNTDVFIQFFYSKNNARAKLIAEIRDLYLASLLLLLFFFYTRGHVCEQSASMRVN